MTFRACIVAAVSTTGQATRIRRAKPLDKKHMVSYDVAVNESALATR